MVYYTYVRNAWVKFSKMAVADLPSSCSQSLKQSNKLQFPNIYTLLKIGCVLPVISYAFKRSFSSMRRLKNHMRCSMCQDRLSYFELMHIHHDMKIDTEKVVDIIWQESAKEV